LSEFERLDRRGSAGTQLEVSGQSRLETAAEAGPAAARVEVALERHARR
jgi:hypothetical protein